MEPETKEKNHGWVFLCIVLIIGFSYFYLSEYYDLVEYEDLFTFGFLLLTSLIAGLSLYTKLSSAIKKAETIREKNDGMLDFQEIRQTQWETKKTIILPIILTLPSAIFFCNTTLFILSSVRQFLASPPRSMAISTNERNCNKLRLYNTIRNYSR